MDAVAAELERAGVSATDGLGVEEERAHMPYTQKNHLAQPVSYGAWTVARKHVRVEHAYPLLITCLLLPPLSRRVLPLTQPQGPYFLGSDISLVDITFAPMLERAAASLTYYKGFHLRGQGRWPAVDRCAGAAAAEEWGPGGGGRAGAWRETGGCGLAGGCNPLYQ